MIITSMHMVLTTGLSISYVTNPHICIQYSSLEHPEKYMKCHGTDRHILEYLRLIYKANELLQTLNIK